MKVLNLYAGVGGNRKYWDNCEITAVEYNSKIADIYRELYPQDIVVVGDAHEYLLGHYDKFDFIWSSPPCQSHSKMVKATRHKKARYPDMRLYEEILFLKNFYKGLWVIENVIPYYGAMLNPKRVGRHLFWSNFEFDVEDVDRPSGFINQTNTAGKKALMEWLGIEYKGNVYYEGNHCPAQILRNCVHPKLGKQIFEQMKLLEQKRKVLGG